MSNKGLPATKPYRRVYDAVLTHLQYGRQTSMVDKRSWHSQGFRDRGSYLRPKGTGQNKMPGTQDHDVTILPSGEEMEQRRPNEREEPRTNTWLNDNGLKKKRTILQGAEEAAVR
jgi:hypothetical protein